MATKEEIDFILLRLGAAYPWVSLHDATVEVYSEHLEDVPTDWLLGAAEAHIDKSNDDARGRFFPSIAELRQPYDEWRAKQARADKDRQWKANLEKWRQEAIGPGDSRKMLSAVVDAAKERTGKEIVPFRGRGLKRVLAEAPKDFIVEVSDEKLRRAKEGA